MNRFNLMLAVLLTAGLFLPIQALDTLRVTLPESPAVYEDINDWEWFSLRNFIDWSHQASSSLPAQGEDAYGPEMMTDGLARTAWIEGREDYGEGEFVTFYFDFSRLMGPLEEFNDSVMFCGFYVMNGYCKNEETWEANSRAKTLKLYYNEEPICIIELHDVMYLQSVYFPELLWVKPNDSMRVEILEAYPGTKYSDTALSELMPKSAQM